MNPWSTRARRFRVGALVLGCSVLFLGMVAFTIGRGLHEEHVAYEIEFKDSVKGMVVGSKVNFQGVPIGSVSDIRFRKGQTLVTVRVDPAKATIQTVTKARLDRLLVTGQVTVELDGYEEGGKDLAPGGVIATSSSPIDQLTHSLPEVLGQASKVLAGLDALVTRWNTLFDERNLMAIEGSLANLHRASIEIPRRLDAALAEVPTLSKDVQRTLTSLRSTSHDFGELLRREDLAETLTEVRALVTRFSAAGESLRLALDELQGILRVGRPGFFEAVAGLGATLAEVQRLARDLRLQPAALLYGRKLDAAPAPQGGGR